MKWRNGLMICMAGVGLSGCSLLGYSTCMPGCHSQTHSASSLVSFLYPDGRIPPPDNTIPELHVPLRVGLAFLPSQASGAVAGLDAAHEAELLERIKQRFAARKFVNEIVLIPDYYLSTRRGFAGLEGVQRLYNIDVMALVSYDQVTHQDDNKLSLGYLTIVGAYVLRGSSHDTTTLVDLAVVDPGTRSLVLRAGGTDMRQGNSTLVDRSRDSRAASVESFGAATDQLIGNFDAALVKFEADVRDGKANVRVVKRNTVGGVGGGGSMSVFWIAALLLASAVRASRMKLRHRLFQASY